MRLEIGDDAPSFELKDKDGVMHSKKDLLGQKYVLYFYPKDNTKGCTMEARDFALYMEDFEKSGYKIYGVSPDSAKSHAKFCEAQDLHFTLLCDPQKAVATAYGAFGKKMLYGKEHFGIIRSTFFIDEKGKISKCFYNVRASGHVGRLLRQL